MKPSEYFYSMDNGKIYLPTKQIVLDMDKRFIDREELKTKILNKIKENDNNSEYGFSCITKEEILELLENENI
jgi:hypothetical protein